MTGDTSDPELADDLVGVASARLTAAGVPRGERLRALRLLSILSTLADTDLRVRRPLSMVASEFDLPADEVDIWLDDLVAIGVVRVAGAAMVLGGREPSREVRMTLHDFLDAAEELDAAPAPRRAHPLLLRPASAVLAAAAVVALAFVGPAMLDRPSTPVANTRNESPVVITTSPRSAADRSGTTVAEPFDDRNALDDRNEGVGPVVVATTSTTVLPCPSGTPVLEVTGATVEALGRLAVHGVAHNPSSEAITVESFTLRATVYGQEIAAPGTKGELMVPAHSSVLWQAELPVIAPPSTPVRATLGDWDWQGVNAHIDCPSP